MKLLNAFLQQLREAKPLASIRIDAEPTPASRPRVAKAGWAYYPKTYKDWLAAAKKCLRAGPYALDSKTPLIVLVDSVVARPKKPTNPFPKGDADNYAKGPLDAVTKVTGYWVDDNQITLLLSAKRYTQPGEEPHTLIEIYST